jgi:hypothetical protein
MTSVGQRGQVLIPQVFIQPDFPIGHIHNLPPLGAKLGSI